MPITTKYTSKSHFIQTCMSKGWVAPGDAMALSAAYDFVSDPKGLDAGAVDEFLEKITETDMWSLEARQNLQEEMGKIFRPLAEEDRVNNDYQLDERIVNHVENNAISQKQLNDLRQQFYMKAEKLEAGDYSLAEAALGQGLLNFEDQKMEQQTQYNVEDEPEQNENNIELEDDDSVSQYSDALSTGEKVQEYYESLHSRKDPSVEELKEGLQPAEEKKEEVPEEKEENLADFMYGEQGEENAFDDVKRDNDLNAGELNNIADENLKNEENQDQNQIFEEKKEENQNQIFEEKEENQNQNEFFGGNPYPNSGRETTYDIRDDQRNAVYEANPEIKIAEEPEQEVEQNEQEQKEEQIGENQGEKKEEENVNEIVNEKENENVNENEDDKEIVNEDEDKKENENEDEKENEKGKEELKNGEASFVVQDDLNKSFYFVADENGDVIQNSKESPNKINTNAEKEESIHNLSFSDLIIKENSKKSNTNNINNINDINTGSINNINTNTNISNDRIDLDKSVTYSRKDKNVVKIPGVKPLKDGLKKFNTNRWLSSKESLEHVRAREAAEGLINLKNRTDFKEGMSNLDYVEKMAFAMNWLEQAGDLHQKVQHYVEVKDPLSLAGRDRKTGAKQLSAAAAEEVAAAEAMIKAQGLSVSVVYGRIADVKLQDAVDAFDVNKAAKFNDLSETEQKKLMNTVYDVLAAKVSSASLQGNRENTAGGNFFAVRHQMDRSVWMSAAVVNYLSQTGRTVEDIRNDLKDGGKGLYDKIDKSVNEMTEGAQDLGKFAKPEAEITKDTAWNPAPAKNKQNIM